MFEIIRTYPVLFALLVILPFFGGVIGGVVGAYLGWDSLKGKYEVKRHKAKVESKIISLDESDTIQKDILQQLEDKERIVTLGNKAISRGSRESYLNLVHIVESFGLERDSASSEISRIISHWSNMTSIGSVILPNENKISTKELIDILLLNSQHLFRARSAQILANINESYVHEALLLSTFSDNHIEVIKESTFSFCKLVGINNSDFFQPYLAWSYWQKNSEKIKESRESINNIEIIPWGKLKEKINKMDNQEYVHMNYWWETTFEMIDEFLNKEQKGK